MYESVVVLIQMDGNSDTLGTVVCTQKVVVLIQMDGNSDKVTGKLKPKERSRSPHSNGR